MVQFSTVIFSDAPMMFISPLTSKVQLGISHLLKKSPDLLCQTPVNRPLRLCCLAEEQDKYFLTSWRFQKPQTSVVMTEVYDPFRIPPLGRMDTWDSYMKFNILFKTLLIETVKHECESGWTRNEACGRKERERVGGYRVRETLLLRTKTLLFARQGRERETKTFNH